MLSWTRVFTLLVISPTLADYHYQTQLNRQDDWQKYIRSPPNELVRPVRVLGNYTRGNVTNPDGLVTGKELTLLTRRATAQSDITPVIVVDFGQNIAGLLSINFGGAYSTSRGLPGIRLAFSETLQFLSNVSDFSRSNNGETITPGSDQIAVRRDSYTWTAKRGCEFPEKVCNDGLHGFRYVKIYLDALPEDAPYTSSQGQVSIDSMSLEFTGFLGTADTFTGFFESSDDQLNQWWYDGVYTNDMCTDTFRLEDTDPRRAGSPSLVGKLVLHDGAKRDRDPYIGDLAVASRTSYVSHDTSEATKNVLADIAEHQRADGWLPPASIVNYTLPLFDYPLWWVTCSYDLFMYTGDFDYIIKYYPNLQRVLDNFYPTTTDPSTGLLNKLFGVAHGYGDYAFLPRTGPVTYYNALYVIALDNAASIARYLDHQNDAYRWSARARKVSAAMNGLFDNSAGAFYDGSCGSKLCKTHAQDGNSLSILSGAADSTRAKSILSYLSTHHARPYGNSFYDNDVIGPFSQRVYAFISYFEIEARFKTGLADSALEEIRRLYGWMSTHDPGITTWEGIGANGIPYEDGFTSMAHGWGTGVTPALTNYVLGIMPTGPGFSTWSVKPIPGDVQWAKGRIATPIGPIDVSWTRDSNGFYLAVTSPAGTRGVVSLPAENGTVSHDSMIVDGMMDWGYMNMPVDGGSTHTFAVKYDF
ncbi:related to alpha-L-rhamnosidase A [Rhynchosporium agropyri]|uniref:Related to alpha-L-rhamnosidase A n=1 Tax=Rhynchosporium agropyri TaxID=914238 RepID=A0A1E1LP78_9HELO|nr:related to alpha-L-rhamnosidase A [Rhynchosporium agropyri]